MPQELREFSERVGQLITQRGMGRRSRAALRAALDAAETEGVGGIWVIRIPPKTKDYIDVDYTVHGSVSLTSRFETVGAS